MIFDARNHLPILNLMEVLFVSFFPRPGEERTQWSKEDLERVASSCLANIFFYLYKDLSAFCYNISLNYTQKVLHTMWTYIETNYKTANLKELAHQLNCSESTLSRNIYKMTGSSFLNHVQMFRFSKAANLLTCTSLPIADIAASVGYENFSYFYRKFREFYHCSPKKYREHAYEAEELFCKRPEGEALSSKEKTYET